VFAASQLVARKLCRICNGGAVLYRYLAIQLPKDKGDTDWGGTLSQAQIDYALDDVRYSHRLWVALQRQLQDDRLLDCFMERMRFAPLLSTPNSTACRAMLAFVNLKGDKLSALSGTPSVR